MPTRTALLRRAKSFVPRARRFLLAGLVYSGTGWTCGSTRPGGGAPCLAVVRPTRHDVRRGLEEIERYLAAHA